jgi:hypothetical protein
MRKPDELKFLLQLLGCNDYRSPFSAFKKLKSNNQICQTLESYGYIDFTREIASIQLLPTGKGLLKLEPQELPLNKKEIKVLQAIAVFPETVTPSQLKLKTLKAAEREEILHQFAEKGLISLTTRRKKQKAQVWLTEKGLEFLRDEFIPHKGNQPVISLDLLKNYLNFLRKTLGNPNQQSVTQSPTPSPTITQDLGKNPFSGRDYVVSSFDTTAGTAIPQNGFFGPTTPITEEYVLQCIKDLDQKLGTGNYLPIFHLREKLQPPLSREELDQILYRLAGNDKIELSTLAEVKAYSIEEINAGIPQPIGGPLFFIIVV